MSVFDLQSWREEAERKTPEQSLIGDFIGECSGLKRLSHPKTLESPTAIIVLSAPQEQKRAVLRGILLYATQVRVHWQQLQLLHELWKALAPKTSFENDDTLCEFLNEFASVSLAMSLSFPAKPLAQTIAQHIQMQGLSDRLLNCVLNVRKALYQSYNCADADSLAHVLGDAAPPLLVADESFSNLALNDYDGANELEKKVLRALWNHLGAATSSKPSQKWLKEAKGLIEKIGSDEWRDNLKRYYRAFSSANESPIEANLNFLRGLMWCGALFQDTEAAHLLGQCAVSANKTALIKRSYDFGGEVDASWEEHRPRCPKVGGAAIWALSQWDDFAGVTQLSGLKRKIKNRTTLGSIETAIINVAERLNVTPEDLEEIAVPDFGLENGFIVRDFNAVHLEIEVASGKATWNWSSEGKPLKAAPASVKRDFAAELKELKTTASELERVFAAQKERLDGLLRSEKSWPLATWQSRYLEHPLMALLARRVIWSFEENGEKIAALPTKNGFIDASGASVSLPAESEVKLWHPLGDSTENVLNWRRYFENSGQKQPFKQAHREIYLLTDAERTTRTYSNRFAAHVLKQHQFNSLCAARGWKNSLRLMVDDEYPPATKIWPNYALRAEFWIEGIGEDYGTDTNETGTYLRVSTDQVRFYPLDAPGNSAHAGGGGYRVGYRAAPTEALDLESVPPLIFSETMRDCDLFVGVASLGADDAWRDGGPQGHFRDYWRDYSFGELGETAKSRADVLSRLLPRLKIRDAATLDGRFLRVQGRLRAYKIHLGSGNILMETNDQYLCIVPARDENADVFLPFEGDKTLAVILSKAFLLADDDKIKDAGIMRQIKS